MLIASAFVIIFQTFHTKISISNESHANLLWSGRTTDWVCACSKHISVARAQIEHLEVHLNMGELPKAD